MALYFFWYNFIRQHKTLRMTPAMAADLSPTALDFSDLIVMIDAAERKQLVDKRAAMLLP